MGGRAPIVCKAQTKDRVQMLRCRLAVLVGVVFVLLMSSPAAWAQSFAPIGNLDCNGYSQIQQPLKPQQVCADFRGAYDERGYDNGDYIGHDEPAIGFISTAPRSGNNVQWEFTLPRAAAAGDTVF